MVPNLEEPCRAPVRETLAELQTLSNRFARFAARASFLFLFAGIFTGAAGWTAVYPDSAVKVFSAKSLLPFELSALIQYVIAGALIGIAAGALSPAPQNNRGLIFKSGKISPGGAALGVALVASIGTSALAVQDPKLSPLILSAGAPIFFLLMLALTALYAAHGAVSFPGIARRSLPLRGEIAAALLALAWAGVNAVRTGGRLAQLSVLPSDVLNWSNAILDGRLLGTGASNLFFDRLSRSPVVGLFSLLPWFGDPAATLLALQLTALAAGALPLYAIVREYGYSPAHAVTIVVLYLTSPIQQILYYHGFVPAALGVPFLFAFCLFLKRGALAPALISAAILALFGEEFCWIALIAGALQLFSSGLRPNRRLGFAVIALSMTAIVLFRSVYYPMLVLTPSRLSGPGDLIAYVTSVQPRNNIGDLLPAAGYLLSLPVTVLIHLYETGFLHLIALLSAPVVLLPLLSPLFLLTSVFLAALTLAADAPRLTSLFDLRFIALFPLSFSCLPGALQTLLERTRSFKPHGNVAAAALASAVVATIGITVFGEYPPAMSSVPLESGLVCADSNPLDLALNCSSSSRSGANGLGDIDVGAHSDQLIVTSDRERLRFRRYPYVVNYEQFDRILTVLPKTELISLDVVLRMPYGVAEVQELQLFKKLSERLAFQTVRSSGSKVVLRARLERPDVRSPFAY